MLFSMPLSALIGVICGSLLDFLGLKVGEVVAELFQQKQLWDDGPQPDQTAFDLLALSLADVREDRDDSARFDHGLQWILSSRYQRAALLAEGWLRLFDH